MTPVAGTRRFTGDLLWTGAANALGLLLVGTVTMPAMTKSYTSEVFGVWSQANTTMSLLMPILVMHLGITLVRFLAGEESRARRRETFAAMLWPVVGFSCIAVLISLPLEEPLSSLLFGSPRYGLLAVLTVAWAAQEAVFSFLMCYQQASRQMRRIAVFRITQGVVRAALIVGLAVMGYELKWVVASVVGVGLVWSAIALALVVRELGLPMPTANRLGEYLAFSLPNMPAWILSWSIVGSSRYFLTHFASLSDAGVFSASWTLTNLVLLVSAPVASVLYPAVTEAWQQGQLSRVRSYFWYSTKLFLGVGVPAVAGLCVLSQPLLRLLATSEYAVGGSLVFLMSAATLFLGMQQIYVNIFYLVKQTKWMPVVYGVAAATNIGLNVALIPSIGLVGAAIAVLVSYFLLALMCTIWVARAIGHALDWLFLSKVVLASSAMALCIAYIPIHGAIGIILTIILGVGVFAVGLVVLRAFSEQDRALIRDALHWGRTIAAAGPSSQIVVDDGSIRSLEERDGQHGGGRQGR